MLAADTLLLPCVSSRHTRSLCFGVCRAATSTPTRACTLAAGRLERSTARVRQHGLGQHLCACRVHLQATAACHAKRVGACRGSAVGTVSAANVFLTQSHLVHGSVPPGTYWDSAGGCLRGSWVSGNLKGQGQYDQPHYHFEGQFAKGLPAGARGPLTNTPLPTAFAVHSPCGCFSAEPMK